MAPEHADLIAEAELLLADMQENEEFRADLKDIATVRALLVALRAGAQEGRWPSAWGEFGDGHDYSRTGKHDPNYCRVCLTVENVQLTARVEHLEQALRGTALTLRDRTLCWCDVALDKQAEHANYCRRARATLTARGAAPTERQEERKD